MTWWSTSDRADPAPTDLEHLLDRVADDLADRFTGTFDHETVLELVIECYEMLAIQARVSTHLVALAHHFAKDRLLAIATVEGLRPRTAPQVLFVCVHNAGRSQMAAALLRHHADGRVGVRSAGSAPTGLLDPGCVSVLQEVGIGLAQAFPKPLTDDVVRAADVVVTMGCGETCPVFPGRRYLDWDVADPADQPLSVVRSIRDDLDTRVRALLVDLS
ncbi:MAG TPA: arsenate reductase ArsC [Actinokineospora sp.]|nr:arsenate reductase ArsC [Actinokineospora sp.]